MVSHYEEHRLRMSKVTYGIHGHKRKEIIGEWRKCLHHVLLRSSNKGGGNGYDM